jgi:hypothetical protein
MDSMKRYALIRLLHNANTVIAECGPCDFEEALSKFRKMCGNTLYLDDDGYGKLGEVTFCIAEFHENFATLP